jgi:hypothetical protein
MDVMNHRSLDSVLYKEQEIEFQNWHAPLLNKHISSQQKYPQGWIKKFMNHYNFQWHQIFPKFQDRKEVTNGAFMQKIKSNRWYLNGFCLVD